MDAEHGVPVKMYANSYLNAFRLFETWHQLKLFENITYVLFFSKNSQKSPERKNSNAIMKYSDGKGISPADK